MNDSEPRVTTTHAADESEGTILGVSTPSFWLVALALGAGVLLFNQLVRLYSISTAAIGAVLPAVVVLVVLRFLQAGRPAGYVGNLVDTAVTGGHAQPRRDIQSTGSRLFGAFPEAFQVDGLTVFGGPAEGHAAKAWEIQTPDLQTASAAELNRHQDAWSSLLRQLSPDDVLQVTLTSTAGEATRLLAYRETTEACTCGPVRLLRNLNFIRQWERMTQGDLRRRQVVVFLARPLTGSAPWRPSEAKNQYDLRLAEARTAFAQSEQVLHRVLEPVGARTVPLSDTDVVRLWADRLNPSLREQIGFDPAVHFDPELSLVDNCLHSDLRSLGRQGFILDGYHHVAMGLQRLPGETYPTLCQALTHLPFGGITLVARVQRRDKEPILRRAQVSVERIQQQTARKPDERLSVSQAQLDDKIRRLSRGDVVPLEFELTLLLRAKTAEELSQMVAAVKAAVQTMNGAQVYEATLPATSRNLFTASLPGNPTSRRAGFLHYGEDRYVADLLPVSSTFLGHAGPVEALFPGADGNLVNVVSFLGEGNGSTPQNLTLLGATGTGKSVVLEKLLHETDPFFGFTAVIDFGQSQASYPRSHGLEPVVLKLDGSQVLNPFDTHGLPLSPFITATLTALVVRIVGMPRDEDKARRQAGLIDRELQQLHADKAQEHLRQWSEPQRETFLRHSLALHRWMTDHRCPLLDAFLEFRGFQREKPEEAKAITAGFTVEELRNHESQHGREVQALVFAYLKPEEHLRLSSLREHFEIADDETSRWLAVLLVPWTEDGAYGRLFDGVGNTPATGAVQYFELGHLPKAAKDVTDVVGFQLINQLHHTCLTLPRGMRKRIVVEELSRFLEIQGAEAILRELAESFRKFNVQLVTTAQTYARIADTPIRAALVGSTRAWLIFNTGDRRDIERLGADLGLSRVAQEAILKFPRPDQQA
ncbi:MAG: hypothetical protein AB7J34_13955, partial [Limisphaerales bacterium]